MSTYGYRHALTLTPTYVDLLCCLNKICISACVWSALSFSSSLNLFFSLTRPSLQTQVTLLHQMAFCLAELHLWSTKSSLKVKGSTYHHVQSPTLSIILSLALSVIAHFVFTPSPHLTCIYINNLTVSQHQFSICFHFLFALFRFSCYQCLFIALYMTFFILL